MQTFLILLVIHNLLLYIILKKRFWVIEKLAGKRSIIMNVKVTGATLENFEFTPGSEAFVAHCFFDNLSVGGARPQAKS